MAIEYSFLQLIIIFRLTDSAVKWVLAILLFLDRLEFRTELYESGDRLLLKLCKLKIVLLYTLRLFKCVFHLNYSPTW